MGCPLGRSGWVVLWEGQDGFYGHDGSCSALPSPFLLHFIADAREYVCDMLRRQGFARNDENHGSQNKQDADAETHAERLAEDEYADAYRRDRFQGSHHRSRSRADVVYGYYHEHQ